MVVGYSKLEVAHRTPSNVGRTCNLTSDRPNDCCGAILAKHTLALSFCWVCDLECLFLFACWTRDGTGASVDTGLCPRFSL